MRVVISVFAQQQIRETAKYILEKFGKKSKRHFHTESEDSGLTKGLILSREEQSQADTGPFTARLPARR